MPLPASILDAATRYFTEHFEEAEHRVVRTATDRHPASGQPIYLVAAVSGVAPNKGAVELILDAESNHIELLPNQRRSLFVPDVTPVPREIVDAVQVRIDPPTNNLELGECDTVRETITVTLPPSAAVAPADIYFLADNTGSMGPAISAVQTGASAIFAALSATPGLQFGVGEYQDFDNAGDMSLAFQNRQAITANQAAVTAALNSWTAIPGAGGDGPEAQLYALDQVAVSPAISWRPGVKHIVVWFGDAPGHDPICAAASGLGYDITEASVTSKLASGQITVLALSLTGTDYANDGLNADPTNLLGGLNAAYTACGAPGGTPGQATRIAAATGGIVVTNVDPTTIVATIIAQLKALLTINDVHLQPVGAITPFVTSIAPPSYGPLPGDQENILKFEVTFSGDVVDCAKRDRVFTGAIDVVVDGQVVGAKPTTITVPACKYTYAVKFVCGRQDECNCSCGPVRPGIYATEVNILNPKCDDANITKRVVPMVFAGAVTGREPAVAQARVTDQIVLPSGAATMDDCCRFAELLYGGAPASTMPLTVGFMEIISNRELHVTAVYTASDLKGKGLSVAVETVPGKLT